MRGRPACADSGCSATPEAHLSFGAAYLRGVLEEHLPEGATGLAVALSGGADSACLLTALQQVGVESVRGSAVSVRGLPVRALHVDHGLQPLSTAFREASAALWTPVVPVSWICGKNAARADSTLKFDDASCASAWRTSGR